MDRRRAMTLGLYLLMTSIGVRAAEPVDDATWHLRTEDRLLTETIHQGVIRSATFRYLVDRLRDSDVVAYVERGESLPRGVGGATSFIGAASGWRYIRVRISCQMTHDQRIAIMAHELRHAVEIAEAPAVVDGESLSRLYGDPVNRYEGRNLYESRQAIEAQHQVARELRMMRTIGPPSTR